jgi:hypothetical protein
MRLTTYRPSPRTTASRSRHRRGGLLGRLGVVGAWRTASAAVISLGAVAGAVVTLVSFWPDPDPADVARFTTVQITAHRMPISEYRLRATPQAVPDTGDRPPQGREAADRVAERAEELADAQGLLPERSPDVGGVLRNITPVVTEDGGPVDPVAAANRIVEILKDSCRRVTDPQGGSTLSEPLGVVVRADIELQGMRDRTVALSWSMWERDGGGRLHGDWLNDNLTYRLRPGTEHDTASLDLWVPLPRETGPYVIRTTLRADGVSLASGETTPFS